MMIHEDNDDDEDDDDDDDDDDYDNEKMPDQGFCLGSSRGRLRQPEGRSCLLLVVIQIHHRSSSLSCFIFIFIH